MSIIISGLSSATSTVSKADEDIHSPWNGHDTLVLVMTSSASSSWWCSSSG